ncbi:DUF1127 domain-containing protein [Chelativorans sp. SCAU2101]|jgi:uncharacterized protein YjiS (DUF1127 family)|uniref:DUF1127 domain-containing protein n=1 Tax=Chelativorans petroleitrophicus TaxID=2975484 RepID=A0A9X2X7E0_9HYPH|nr:DUF1127 domain-containing protein [Chelativorans petroleitrophicus]MCT8990033.1 DUF1127 domain-containing protein [Chelativorans petroleitrophicus]
MQNTPASRKDRTLVRPGAFRHLAAAALALVLRLEDRRRQRLHLSELDDHLLADIGLTQADVERECSTPFWR